MDENFNFYYILENFREKIYSFKLNGPRRGWFALVCEDITPGKHGPSRKDCENFLRLIPITPMHALIVVEDNDQKETILSYWKRHPAGAMVGMVEVDPADWPAWLKKAAKAAK